MKKKICSIVMALVFSVLFSSVSAQAAEKDMIIEDAENNVEVGRVSGSTRYDTAYAIADMLKEKMDVEQFDAIVIACGSNFPDALSGSYLASVKNAPILLAKEKYADVLQAYIRDNLILGGEIYVLGGEEAVPESIVGDFAKDYEVKRLQGKTRYETNLEILKESGVGENEILICTGSGYADSLAASATGKPILLVKKTLSDEQKTFLEENSDKNFYIIGGTNAVGESLENEIEKIVSSTRIYGNTRYETSVVVAETFFEEPDAVTFAYAKNFPDGLCGGALAQNMNAPLLLIAAGKEADAESYVETKGSGTGIVFGGSAILPDKTVRNVFGYVENVSKENYKQAVNYLKEAENCLREDDLEKGIEYLQKVYAITKNQTVLNFIKRLEEGGYNTEGIELQLGRAKTVVYYDNGEVFASYENTYDDIGRWIQMKGKYDDPGLFWYDQYLYDVNGNHIETNSYVHDDRAVTTLMNKSRHENVFDESGRCVRVNYYRDGYGEDVLMYYLDYYGASGEYTGYDLWSYDMAYYYDTSRTRMQVRYQYDSEGRKSFVEEKGQEAGIYDPDWRRCTTYVYDEEGKCIEKKLTYDNNRFSEEITAYIYDGEGRCVQEKTEYKDESYDKVTKYTYGNSLHYETEEVLYRGYRDYWEYIYDELELYIGFNSKHNFSGYYFIV